MAPRKKTIKKPVQKKEEVIKKDIIQNIDPTFYDEDYFENGLVTQKSSYAGLLWDDKYLDIAKDLIAEFKPTKVLDVGCAKGFIIKAFKKNNVYAVGCDISEYAIKNCEPEVKNFVTVCSITDLKPYRTKAFDLVLAYDIIEHLTDTELELAVKELYRVLDLNGVLTIKTPDQIYDWDNDKSHINIKPQIEWIKLFSKHNFKNFIPNVPEKYWGAFDYRRTMFFKKV